MAGAGEISIMILLIGYGYWGQNLARNFSKELSAVCDSDENRLAVVRDRYPGVTTYNNIDQALAHPGLRAVLIATKARHHLNIACMAIERGLDAWIEKPVCETLDQINQLITVSEQHQRIVFVDHTFCYHPAVEYIAQTSIGNPIYYDSTRISLGLFQQDVDALLDLAIHDLSIIDFLYPDLELKDRDIIRNCHVTDLANQVLVNLKFNNGFTANINANWVSPVKKRQIILTGDQRSIVYDDIDPDKIKIYSTGNIDVDYSANQLGDMLVPRIGTTEALSNARQHFLQSINDRCQPRTNIYRAKKIMEWVS